MTRNTMDEDWDERRDGGKEVPMSCGISQRFCFAMGKAYVLLPILQLVRGWEDDGGDEAFGREMVYNMIGGKQ